MYSNVWGVMGYASALLAGTAMLTLRTILGLRETPDRLRLRAIHLTFRATFACVLTVPFALVALALPGTAAAWAGGLAAATLAVGVFSLLSAVTRIAALVDHDVQQTVDGRH